MTNEQIKQKLLSLFDSGEDFEVVQTGKQSRKVNGLYNVNEREIILHNLNFKGDNALMYTAIHEYAHHVVCSHRRAEGLPIKERCHDTEFWATMDNLVETAIEKGVYKRNRSGDLSGLIEKAKKLDAEITRLQSELGEVLIEIQSKSKEEDERFEDITAHELKMKEATIKKCCRFKANDVSGFGQDEAEAISKSKGRINAQEMKTAFSAGKTVNQIKQEENDAKNKSYSPLKKFQKEKRRIEKTISALEQRLSFLTETIQSLEEAA